MITKVLFFDTQHEAAEGLKKLEANGFTHNDLRVIVSDLEHSKLLNAETALHIDLLSEITNANRTGSNDDDPSVAVPFFAPQASMQIPLGVFPVVATGLDGHDSHQATEALQEYGLADDVAENCLHALRDGQCVVCILNYQAEGALFDSLYMGLSNNDNENWLPDTGATKVLDNG